MDANPNTRSSGNKWLLIAACACFGAFLIAFIAWAILISRPQWLNRCRLRKTTTHNWPTTMSHLFSIREDELRLHNWEVTSGLADPQKPYQTQVTLTSNPPLASIIHAISPAIAPPATSRPYTQLDLRQSLHKPNGDMQLHAPDTTPPSISVIAPIGIPPPSAQPGRHKWEAPFTYHTTPKQAKLPQTFVCNLPTPFYRYSEEARRRMGFAKGINTNDSAGAKQKPRPKPLDLEPERASTTRHFVPISHLPHSSIISIGSPQINAELEARLTRSYNLNGRDKTVVSCRPRSRKPSVVSHFMPLASVNEKYVVDEFELGGDGTNTGLSPVPPVSPLPVSTRGEGKGAAKRGSGMTVFRFHPGTRMEL